VGARDLSGPHPVDVGVVFDRFPASIRGAVLVRGADPDPHQITVRAAYLVEAAEPGRAAAPVEVDQTTVELAPRAEVFFPFDVPVTGLEAGWYGVVAEVVVDGGIERRSEEPGKLFPVAWPGGTVRRGSVAVGRSIPVPTHGDVVVERLEMKGDRAIVQWRLPPGTGEEDVSVLADGRPLPLLDRSERHGVRSATVYPVLRAHRTLAVRFERIRGADGSWIRGPWDLEIPLP